MGTEIIAMSIAQIFLLLYSIAIRGIHFAVGRFREESGSFGVIYKSHAALVVLISILIPLSWLYAISSDYGFSIKYILLLQVPLIVLTAFSLMGVSAWSNLTSTSKIAQR